MKNVICIEGVVGAGKTTLGELLANELGIEFFLEPYVNNPFLDKFYLNKERYSFLSQMYFLNKRIDVIEESKSFSSCIMDRSIYGDFLFAKMHLKNGYMSEDEFELYDEFWKKLISARKAPSLIIYLEISVENAMKKIESRGRSYELEVSKEYWTSLNNEYELFFENYKSSPILKINIDDLDIRDKKADREYFFNAVRAKLKELEI